MKNDLLFDFTIDKSTKTVFVNREFAAGLSLVWDAFTKQEILTNGGHLNRGYQKQNLWISKLVDEDFMLW